MTRQRASYGAVDLETSATDADWTHATASMDRGWSARSATKLSQRDGTAASVGETLLSSLVGVQGWICVLSALSGFVFGYDLCVMVIALPLIQKVRLAPA